MPESRNKSSPKVLTSKAVEREAELVFEEKLGDIGGVVECRRAASKRAGGCDGLHFFLRRTHE